MGRSPRRARGRHRSLRGRSSRRATRCRARMTSAAAARASIAQIEGGLERCRRSRERQAPAHSTSEAIREPSTTVPHRLAIAIDRLRCGGLVIAVRTNVAIREPRPVAGYRQYPLLPPREIHRLSLHTDLGQPQRISTRIDSRQAHEATGQALPGNAMPGAPASRWSSRRAPDPESPLRQNFNPAGNRMHSSRDVRVTHRSRPRYRNIPPAVKRRITANAHIAISRAILE